MSSTTFSMSFVTDIWPMSKSTISRTLKPLMVPSLWAKSALDFLFIFDWFYFGDNNGSRCPKSGLNFPPVSYLGFLQAPALRGNVFADFLVQLLFGVEKEILVHLRSAYLNKLGLE